MLGNKQDKKYIDMLQKENTRLESEVKKLRAKLQIYEDRDLEVEKIKNDYISLISDIENVKKEYHKKLEDINNLETEYRASLDRILNEININK